MGDIQLPLMNPLRFTKTTSRPDNTDIFPNPDNIEIGIKYQSGMYAGKYVREHLKSKKITFQARLSDITDTRMSVYKKTNDIFSLVDTVLASQITPTGWTGYNVYKYEYTPITNGVYRFDFNEENWQSDPVLVTNDLKLIKQLVNIQYTNTFNGYDMVFMDDDTNVYTGNVYLSGMIDIGAGKNELSTFEGDRGITEKLRGTPVRTALLKLSDIHWSYQDLLQWVFSCDTLTINGITYQTDENLTFEKKGKSDLFDSTVNLYQTGINFYNG